MQPKRSEANLAEFGSSSCSKHSAGMLACGHFADNQERRARCKVMVILQTGGYSRIAISTLSLGNVPADCYGPFHRCCSKLARPAAELLHRDAIICAFPTIFLPPEKCEDDLAPGRKGSRGQIERVDSQPGVASDGVLETLPAIQSPAHYGG